MLIVEGDVALDEWKSSLHFYFILTIVFIAIFLFFFLLMPNVYLLTKRVKE